MKITSSPVVLVLSFYSNAIDVVLEKGMSASIPYVDETADEQTADHESSVKSWSDDELFDNVAVIINENFVLEVEASLRDSGAD